MSSLPENFSSDAEKGAVWLVGAGPGDAGLLTLRGREVLERADVVVHDRLVGEGVLALIPEGAERVDVGKTAGRHPIPQRQIEALLVELARAGKRVVRLKGGDPFLFGRGGEEAEALLSAGIPFEVVPGVTSAIAVPAAAGIPVTHRGLSSSLHVITAHGKDGGLPDLDFEALARLGGTFIFLMGVGSVPALCERLLGVGMDPDTPAAAVERGTTARQRRVDATLGALGERPLCPPAVLVVGGVARLDLRSARPLAGKRVAVTRPKGRGEGLCRMLRDAGAEALELPCVATEVLPLSLPPLGGLDWVGFTSVTGVEALFSLLEAEGRDVRELGSAHVAAVGPATAQALRSRGLRVDFTPEVYDVEHLAAGLRRFGGKTLLFRAEGAAATGLPELSLYRVRPVQARLPEGIDVAAFTSASTVRGFAACLGDRDAVAGIHAACLGEPTARAAREAGFQHIAVARRATMESLMEAIIEAAAGRAEAPA